MHLIWPSNIRLASSGYALGWQSDRILCVLTIVEEWTAESILADLYNQTTREKSEDQLHVRVVGCVGDVEPASAPDPDGVKLSIRDGRLVDCSPPMQVLLVDPPDRDRLRYLTTTANRSRPAGSSLARELEVRDEYGLGAGRDGEVDDVEEILRMTNSIRDTQRQIERIRTSSHRSSLSSPRTIWAPVLAVSAFALIPVSAILCFIVQLAEWKILFGLASGASLASRSATLSQLALRAGQLLQAPCAFVRTLHRDDVSVQTRSRRYMRFWNTVWLILNDLILGYCAYQIILHNHHFFTFHLPRWIERHLADSIISALNWLNDWPVGLKLNTPLSQFYSSTLGSMIGKWKDVIIPISRTAVPHLMCALAFASLGGLTLLLAALEDVISLITLHLRLCDVVTRGICRWQLASLGGLWNLFRGKRWNVLRQRTDSYAYDVDQLFLGTLLFTVSAFLFPTVLTYAGLFFMTSMAIRAVAYALSTFRGALNSFPLFELLLRVKEPSRLPAGIHFVLQPSGKGGSGVPCLELRNSPKAISSILGGIYSSPHSAKNAP